MSDLDEFDTRIESILKAARKEPHWTEEKSADYMTSLAPKKARFAELAENLIASVVRPRLALLAQRFGAEPTSDDPPDRCSCWFHYSERFPAATKVELRVEHDVRFERIAVTYEMHMMPVFIKFNERDRLTVSLDDVNVDEVARWTEDRLLEFLDAYLQIDRGEDDFEEDIATDPVCGMRLRRSEASSKKDYYGHPYVFCSDECLHQFQENPKRFVRVATM